MFLVHLKNGLQLTMDFHLILDTKAVILLISFFLAFFISASLLLFIGKRGWRRKEKVAHGRRRRQYDMVFESLLVVVFSVRGVRRKLLSLLDIAFLSSCWNWTWCLSHNETVSTWTHRHSSYSMFTVKRLSSCLVFICNERAEYWWWYSNLTHFLNS